MALRESGCKDGRWMDQAQLCALLLALFNFRIQLEKIGKESVMIAETQVQIENW